MNSKLLFQNYKNIIKHRLFEIKQYYSNIKKRKMETQTKDTSNYNKVTEGKHHHQQQQLKKIKIKNYFLIKGKATVYFKKSNNQVFYNPIQEFNRDLSIAVINSYSAIHRQDSNDKPIEILEALAASGIRSMRYALEIDNSKIVANDLDKTAVELIDTNRKLNNVEHLVESSCADATLLMNTNPKRFDCIDLDPYGTPAPFLDSAIKSIKSGGLMCVTATDAAVLCGK
jgi:tRNA (guanine26-N2/guanine27-N2)-dimethyltransferase